MPVLVADTCVLIDLERGQFLEPVFASGLTLVVPDALYEKELAEHNGAYLRTLGLGVSPLSPDELVLVQQMMQEHHALSYVDCSAFICALRSDHLLLTGDGALRAVAEATQTPIRGVLWVIDQLESLDAVSRATLHSGLSQIATHRRCRLPKSEIEARLARWGSPNKT